MFRKQYAKLVIECEIDHLERILKQKQEELNEFENSLELKRNLYQQIQDQKEIIKLLIQSKS